MKWVHFFLCVSLVLAPPSFASADSSISGSVTDQGCLAIKVSG
jgi:hypothetical protein